ncbi:hypothetical protein PIB30_035739 [Stylosanthes scabra]|uniref:RNase H type-1 domain-containing protein n=1 Tax=Stylosanthes scabra TaxID=79078 RepID=A0ABU6QDP7_9FABA|nr:hypothetical protein [Stylosanthes scabra]
MDATTAVSKKHGDFLTAIQKTETELKTPPPGSESSDNWREPPTHMVKINVDSTIINDKVVGIGVIARDCQGQILMASTWRKALSSEVFYGSVSVESRRETSWGYDFVQNFKARKYSLLYGEEDGS